MTALNLFSGAKPLITSIVILLLVHSLCAQVARNPFEIYASPQDVPKAAVDTTAATEKQFENPFEINPTPQDVKLTPKAKPRKTVVQGGQQRFLFGVILFMLLLLTILMTLFRGLISRTYNAVLNDNMMNQLFREREGGTGLSLFLLYIMFVVNAGIFLYLLSGIYNFRATGNSFIWLLYCVLGFGTLIFLRHLTLTLIGMIFPVQKEIKLYDFTIIIFGIILGIILVPVNVFIAFGPTEIIPLLSQIILGFLALIYAFRSLRGLLIANKFIVFYKFHFLLYICTVEIAPILVITKILFGDTL